MLLFGIDIKPKWHDDDVDTQKGQKCLKNVVFFKRELMFHRVPFLVDRVAIDQPDVVVHGNILFCADPRTVVTIASHEAHVPVPIKGKQWYTV